MIKNNRPAFTHYILFFLLVILPVFACDSGQAPKPVKKEHIDHPEKYDITIAAVGDSLTAGLGVDEDQAYPALLQKRLISDGYKCRVINAGVSGETSSGTLSRIKWVISSLKPDIIILETGANDGLRGIDTDLIKKNLTRIIKIIKQNNIGIILAGMKMLPNLGPEYSSAFEAVYTETAKAQDITLIPFFLEGVAGHRSLNQEDGIHPTARGYRIIVKNIYPYILNVVKNYKEKGR